MRLLRLSLAGVLAIFLSISGSLMGFQVASAETAQPAGADPEYRISAEDLLEISVWREEDLQRQVVVRPDGGISFPLVGEIAAAGLTSAELEEEIASKLKTYVPDAVVSVSVLEVRGLKIYVTGQVRNPGQFLVARYIDIVQAITIAGGFSPFAKKGDIKVVRRVNGREKTFEFNYGRYIKGRDLDKNIMLEADDVVLVP